MSGSVLEVSLNMGEDKARQRKGGEARRHVYLNYRRMEKWMINRWVKRCMG